MTKVAFFEIEDWEEAQVRAALPDAELFFYRRKLDETTPPPRLDFDAAVIFIDSRITLKTLDGFANLRFIATRSTGYDHIDLAACRARNVAVSYVPGYGDHTVAEFAFGLILNLTRKIYCAIDQIKETGTFSLDGLRGADLKGKTIGIVGTGRIGREMVKIAKGFGMNVLAFDQYPNETFSSTQGFSYATFEYLLRHSDIVSLHCPLTPQTRHLVNSGNIKFFKRGAYLINTARGGLVETEALVRALQEGVLAGAGLDVIEEEGETKDELGFLTKEPRPNREDMKTMLENHILMRMPNALVTPHLAFNSQEALERILSTTIENLKGFISGRPVNLVSQ
ncbi:MAG: hydroxyacid dehydrogenase [Candidatus Brennerbacteria bacterium]|nr:hydroxyacid dehydrogenase [Candidatus Brennerbacteria bacterium]